VPTRARIDGLDGLRAFAVVAVLLYHADVRWARGGFIGVDIFFVLSGYLVTSIVLEGFRKTGGLGFRRFWSSRLRRLAPAQLAMIVATTVGLAVLHSDELAGLRGQVLAALTGTTNWYLIATEGSYFEQLGRPAILRHLWSLAVEIQFYLVFPPLLVLALRRWGVRLDRIVVALLVAIVASTILLAVLYTPGEDPTRAYFDTFARLAAPLTGAVLALVWRPRSLERGPAASLGPAVSVAGGIALAGLLWLVHVADDRSPAMYRGGFLLTALLAGVVVAAIVHPGGVLGRRSALASPVLVAVGLRSYGLYLWHWPVFVLLRPGIDVSWSWGVTFVVRMVLTFALTEACYRLVERPWHLRAPDASLAGIRRRLLQPRGVPTGPRLAALGSVAMAFAAVVILAVPHEANDDIADSLAAGQAALAAADSSLAVGPDGEAVTTTTEVGDPLPADDGRLTLVGDSVMLGAAPTLLATFGDTATIDAEVGRQATDLAPVIRQLGAEGRLASTVVVQVGINGTVTEDDLRAVADAAGGRRLLVINARVPRSWEAGNNALVASVVPELPNASVIDWYTASGPHGDWFLDDTRRVRPSDRRGGRAGEGRGLTGPGPEAGPVDPTDTGASAAHVVLIGLMGAGKTTVGRALAARRGRSFVDGDEQLAARTGRSARELWDAEGEAAVRAAERAVLLDALAGPGPDVIAAAAGTIEDAEVRAALGAADVQVVWLRVRPATAAARVGAGDHRPLIDADPGALLERQASGRAPLFAAVADVVLDVEGLAPAELAAMVP
jgi:peptidoglycan/LPS O-acetylase OafA/YrhL/shikimate kinase